MPDGVIAPEDPRAEDIRQLLAQHLAYARTHSPPEDVHALELEGLLDPSVSFFSYRLDGELLGVGAIRRLDVRHAEVKSMHTASSARGRGIGRALVEHIIRTARLHGFLRLSLETGSMPAFAPARSLYASVGFAVCPPFDRYTASPNSVCMTLLLAEHYPGN
ncbi:MAG TPA: GNAT family N-acetyltransferase [Acidimicrobiales bacterium]|nr:GNAT family N-acetyltransferase [Acidimicrobiales bacterium]